MANDPTSRIRWLASEARFGHRLLGPRAAYAVGSSEISGNPHFIVATNVTSVGTQPDCVCIALYRQWKTTENIRRTRKFTLTLLGSDLLDAAWILGAKYSGVRVPDGMDPFTATSLRSIRPMDNYPPILEGGLTALACDVEKVIDDISDHIIYVAKVAFTWARDDVVDDDWVLDTARHHALMQISGTNFAEAWPSGRPSRRRGSRQCSEYLK